MRFWFEVVGCSPAQGADIWTFNYHVCARVRALEPAADGQVWGVTSPGLKPPPSWASAVHRSSAREGGAPRGRAPPRPPRPQKLRPCQSRRWAAPADRKCKSSDYLEFPAFEVWQLPVSCLIICITMSLYQLVLTLGCRLDVFSRLFFSRLRFHPVGVKTCETSQFLKWKLTLFRTLWRL